jgi:hypothetical protein
MKAYIKNFTLAALALSLFFVSMAWSDEAGLLWSTFLGGSGQDMGFAIAVGGSGDVYATGRTGSWDFPATVGAYDFTLNGAKDVFVTKLDPMGSNLIYATLLGGSADDAGWGIAVDSAGNVYLAGDTQSPDFPTTAGAFDTTYNGGGNDAFAAKLNHTGSDLLYATFLGGGFFDGSRGIAVTPAGDAFVSGETASWDFPTTLEAFDETYNDQTYYVGDAFVTKLNPTGSALAYSTFLGGSDYDIGYGIAIDDSGKTYVTGRSYSADFPTTLGAYDTTHNGFADVFVAVLNAAGRVLDYSTFLGGENSEWGHRIAINGSGDVYLAGYSESLDFPTTAGAFDRTYNDGWYDTFVAKLNVMGGALDYSTLLGGSGSDNGYGIALDDSGYAYVIGWTTSRDFPTTAGAFERTYSGGSDDVFVTKLDPTGSYLAYSTFLGGSGRDGGYGVAMDSFGNAYVVGQTHSENFPITVGAFDETYNGGWEVYVAKLSLPSTPVESSTPIAQLPRDYVLHQNYPNPFNASTEIRYQIPEDGHVTLEIFNSLGQEVQILVDKHQMAGEYSKAWDGRDSGGLEVASGLYFCRLQADSFAKTIKMVLMR